MAVKQPERQELEFILPEGILNFMLLFPGQAEDSYTPGNKCYKVEWSGDIGPNESVVQAITKVAQANDPANWQRHIFGANGKLKKLEEMPKRDPAKYPYAAGKYVIGLSMVVSPANVGMKDANLADPAQRARYEQAIVARAPGVVRFPNLAVQADIDRVIALSNERITQGLPGIPEADYYKTLIPVLPHEVWPGCIGRVLGRAYWNANGKPATVGLALERVLLVRQGERLVAQSNPDSAFAAFAPPAELAPPAPAAAWGNLI